jgi:hypothetical protein
MVILFVPFSYPSANNLKLPFKDIDVGSPTALIQAARHLSEECDDDVVLRSPGYMLVQVIVEQAWEAHVEADYVIVTHIYSSQLGNKKGPPVSQGAQPLT